MVTVNMMILKMMGTVVVIRRVGTVGCNRSGENGDGGDTDDISGDVDDGGW